VSHRPAAVALADKLLILRDGRSEFGPREEVLPKIMRTGTPVAPATRPGTGHEGEGIQR
jgi:ABC-type protease/lipase transport system fused ATPase/permease subunit